MRKLFLQRGGVTSLAKSVFGKLGIPSSYPGTVKSYFETVGMKLPQWAKMYSDLSMPTRPRTSAYDYFQQVSNAGFKPFSELTNDELIYLYTTQFKKAGAYTEHTSFEPRRLTDIAPIYKTAGKQPWESSKQYFSRQYFLPLLEKRFPGRWGIDKRISAIGDTSAYNPLERLFVDPTAGIGFVPQKEYIFEPEPNFQITHDLAQEINRRGIFPGIDFSKTDTIDDISKITLALKEHPFVKAYRGAIRLPLDINHMSWFKQPAVRELPKGAKHIRKNKWIGNLFDAEPLLHPVTKESIIPNGQFITKGESAIPGTSIIELDTSAASEGIKQGLAALKFGHNPGQIGVTRIFPERFSTYDTHVRIGNALHEAGLRAGPGGYDVTVFGKRETPFHFSDEEMLQARQGKSQKFDDLYDLFIKETLGKMPKFTKMLNEKDPTLGLEQPFVVGSTFRGIRPLTKSDLFFDMTRSSTPLTITHSVFRTPMYLDFYKHGGLIKTLKNIKNYAR